MIFDDDKEPVESTLDELCDGTDLIFCRNSSLENRNISVIHNCSHLSPREKERREFRLLAASLNWNYDEILKHPIRKSVRERLSLKT